MIKNVIFDLGKVLINNDPSEYLRKYGYDEEKYQALLDAMLELEMQTCDIDEYKNISFFHHLIFKK